MAAPGHANPRSLARLYGLPHAADELFNQMLRIFSGSVNGPHANNPSFYPHHHLASHSHLDYRAGTTLRTPKLSVLGFASLLLGISSTLLLFGSLALFLGFMLIPLILPASIAVCVGASLIASKECHQPTAARSESVKEREIFARKSWI